MRGIRKRNVKGCLALIPLLVLVMVSCILSGCKKGEKYRNIRITDVTGDVTIYREDEDDLEAEEDMKLLSGDELVTEPGASVTLCLDNDKYIVVDEDSKLVLIAEGTKEDSKTSIELEYGAVFSDIKNRLSEESEFEVVTPASVMSVRGTQFEVIYREIKDEAGKIIDKVMKVLTFDGKVSVKPEGSDEKRTCKAGMMEVLVETADGEYEFAEDSREIESEDLSEFSADYLKDALSEEDEDLSKKEKELRENLLEIIEEFFEEVLPEREKEDAVTPGEDDPSEVTPMPGTEDPEEPPVIEPELEEPEPPVIEPEPDVDTTLNIVFHLPKVMKPLDTLEMSDMDELYDYLLPYEKNAAANIVRVEADLQDQMNISLNNFADAYVQGECEIKEAAKAVFGKDVSIRCDGFFSEEYSDKTFGLEDHSTFAEFGVEYTSLNLYPLYTVYVPEDNTSYRYFPTRLMITDIDPATEEEDNTFYTFMVEEGCKMGLPKVGGYDMYWYFGGRQEEPYRQEFFDDRLNWPIIEAEKREGGEAETPAVDENAVFHGVYYFPKLIKNLAELEVTDKESLFDLLDPYRNYMNDYRIWTSKIYEESDFPKEVAEVAKEKKEVLKSAEEYFGEAVEVTCQGFFDTDVEYFYNPYVTVKMSDVKENLKDGDELVFYPVYTITVLSTGETFNFSPVILQIKDGDETREYFVMMEDYMEVQLPELSDVKLTWLTESGDDTGMDSSKVEDVLGWKYIGVNN